MNMRSNLSESAAVSLLLDVYGQLLTERQRQICVYFHNDDLSLGEIAEDCGITRQGVRAVLTKSETLLRSYENGLGLVAGAIKRREAVQKLADDIGLLHTRGSLNDDARTVLTADIAALADNGEDN